MVASLLEQSEWMVGYSVTIWCRAETYDGTEYTAPAGRRHLI